MLVLMLMFVANGRILITCHDLLFNIVTCDFQTQPDMVVAALFRLTNERAVDVRQLTRHAFSGNLGGRLCQPRLIFPPENRPLGNTNRLCKFSMCMWFTLI